MPQQENLRIIESTKIRAGKRTYYIDVKPTSIGERYIAITESKKVGENFEKHKIFLYKEDFVNFVQGLVHAIETAKCQ